MIALGETIQAGLFLASDQVLSNSGLAGSLISYVIISIMVYFVMTNLETLLLISYVDQSRVKKFIILE
ncbi:unnamed protein product [Rotaria magnacalcarata]|uniref:Amino acid permease/ SLC12A domain-containing protein n=3 Tax=Rotaria magnacalcarata TaxID=392030 RepID=A0A816F6Q6_9BILA|nr:unnamed protein product [Rotaria magnacalcarata]